MKQAFMAMAAAGLVLGGCAGASGPRAARPVDATPVEVSSLRERAIDLLTDSLVSPDPQTRANAIEGLSLAPSRAREAVGPLLDDPNPGVRSVAAMTIGRLRLSGFGARLKELARDPSGFVRGSASYALARTGEDADVSALAGLVLGDPSPRVRAHAAFVLGELGDPSALGLLRDADRVNLPRASPAEVRLLRLQLAEAMVKLGDSEPIEAIRAALYPSRPEELEGAAVAVQIIGELGDKASVDQLVVLSAYKEGAQRMPAEVRLAIASSLAKLGLDRGSFIADEFRESLNPALRAQAAGVYGLTRGAGTLESLEKLMGDEDARVRVAAAAGVVRAADRSASASGTRE